MKVTESEIRLACEGSKTMAEAHRKLGKLKFATFAKYAKAFGLWKPNPSRMGCSREDKSYKHSCEYTCENGLPITSHKLKIKLLRDGVKEHRCEVCGLTEWNTHPIPIELDHIDGNHLNNRLENLRILCPNCHSQTPTNAGKRNKILR